MGLCELHIYPHYGKQKCSTFLSHSNIFILPQLQRICLYCLILAACVQQCNAWHGMHFSMPGLTHAVMFSYVYINCKHTLRRSQALTCYSCNHIMKVILTLFNVYPKLFRQFVVCPTTWTILWNISLCLISLRKHPKKRDWTIAYHTRLLNQNVVLANRRKKASNSDIHSIQFRCTNSVEHHFPKNMTMSVLEDGVFRKEEHN